MRPFSSYPTLAKAFKLMAADSRLSFRDGWKEVCPPSKFDELLQRAESAALKIDGIKIEDYLTPNIYTGVVEPEDNCLETVAAGEQYVADIIIKKTDEGGALRIVLEDAYDGELKGLLFY